MSRDDSKPPFLCPGKNGAHAAAIISILKAATELNLSSEATFHFVNPKKCVCRHSEYDVIFHFAVRHAGQKHCSDKDEDMCQGKTKTGQSGRQVKGEIITSPDSNVIYQVQ